MHFKNPHLTLDDAYGHQLFVARSRDGTELLVAVAPQTEWESPLAGVQLTLEQAAALRNFLVELLQ